MATPSENTDPTPALPSENKAGGKLDLNRIDRLLIVKTSSIGDVIHALPVTEAIRAAKPSIYIGWVVRKRCCGILQGNPVVDTLHVTSDRPTIAEIMRLRGELRARQYQCALDMQGLFLSGIYTWISGAPIRIGIDRNREMNTLFLTHPIVPGKPAVVDGPDRHAVDILFGFAETLGVRAGHPDFSVQSYLAADEDSISAEVARLPGPRIAVNVGASSEYKRWPQNHWRTLFKRLIDDGRSIVFIGDKKDSEAVSEILSGDDDVKRVVNLSGRTSLRELASALAACDVLVSADTGPMHLAVAVGTPVIALFGSTNPDRTGPYGRRNIVLNANLPCAPCYRNPTCAGRVDCMKQIEPETVVLAIEDRLAGIPHTDGAVSGISGVAAHA